jgi:hypothetical protein
VTDPAAAAELRQRLEGHDTHREFDAERLVREGRLELDMRNLTGPLGAQPHVIRL